MIWLYLIVNNFGELLKCFYVVFRYKNSTIVPFLNLIFHC
ncbi:hypothetical protein L291_3981 [Acinetobacter guillouiae MSP4-18]|nr:hypothetical protein L291_3981 [Acinetobacter guillouiae MSP4-18]